MMIESREIKNPSFSSVLVIQCFFNQIWLFLNPPKAIQINFSTVVCRKQFWINRLNLNLKVHHLGKFILRSPIALLVILFLFAREAYCSP